jgi:hypothetical protein
MHSAFKILRTKLNFHNTRSSINAKLENDRRGKITFKANRQLLPENIDVEI